MPEQQNIEFKKNWHDDYLKSIGGFANANGLKELVEEELKLLEPKGVTAARTTTVRKIMGYRPGVDKKSAMISLRSLISPVPGFKRLKYLIFYINVIPACRQASVRD